MANFNQVNSGFSYGAIDPKLQARVDYVAYSKGVKTARNVLSIPQGGFTRRFGTRYTATPAATNKNYIELFSLVYDDSAVYCLVFQNNSIQIYLENTLNATVVTTYPGEIVQKLGFIVADNRLIILHTNFASAQLVRTAVAANIITGIDAVNEYINVTNALTAGTIYPTTFTTAGTLPVTNPQIFVNTLYYVRAITANSVRVYSTPEDAAANINYYDIQVLGAGVSNVILQNTWTLSNIPFSIYPAYDFGFFPTYSAAGFTFTASAVTGTLAAPSVITASAAIFTAAMVGGLFIGNGGVLRIVTFTNNVTVSGYTYQDFATIVAFPGNEAFLGEPAWSNDRGWPSCGTFFQERLFLGATRSIPNGIWGSAIFAAYDFDDSEDLPDNAISYYPSAGGGNFIKAMTSSKSLIVHSNTGNYSTPLTSDVPLTPTTFSMVEQNKDGISDVSPVFIDNQIIYVDRSANNVKSMSWDIVQSSYVNTNISLMSAHLIETPGDMAVFSEPGFTDGFFVILVNDDGNLAIYNTLYEQDVRGWTQAATAQNATTGYFRRVCSGLNRAWVITERTVNFATVLMLEELDFDYPVDSGVAYVNTVATAVLTGLGHLEGQTVQIYADGSVLQDEVVTGGQITVQTAVSLATVGLKFRSLIEPLPVNVQMQTGFSLYQDQHIRQIYIHYYNTVGMTIQGFEIPTLTTQQVVLNQPAIPATGVLEYTLMEGWDGFDYTIQIIQDLPLPMTLLAIGYDIEVS